MLVVPICFSTIQSNFFDIEFYFVREKYILLMLCMKGFKISYVSELLVSKYYYIDPTFLYVYKVLNENFLKWLQIMCENMEQCSVD